MKSPFPHDCDRGRRDILRIGSYLLTAATARVLVHSAAVTGAEPPRLDEKDAQAQALGYRHDAARVDRKKFATYQAGQACGNCQQFQGKPGADWAPCTIFQGKRVNAKGWCSAWVKKTGGAEAPLKG